MCLGEQREVGHNWGLFVCRCTLDKARNNFILFFAVFDFLGLFFLDSFG